MERDKDVEKQYTFSNKQVMGMIAGAIFLTFSGAGLFYRFETLETKMQTLEITYKTKIETLESNHAKEIQALKTEAKLAFSMMQSQLDGKDTRINTIRDRQNARLDKLEETGSDKNPK